MENLRILREQAGLSQQKLADQLGLTQQSVHSYESDDYEPDISTLKAIWKGKIKIPFSCFSEMA